MKIDELNNPDYPERTLHILLVEDNEADIKITLRAFNQAKFKNIFSVVRDGQEGLEYLRQTGNYQDNIKSHPPNLILADINMPRMDGFEFLDHVKADQALRHIPVVMLSSSKIDIDVNKSYQKGAASYIQKPVDYEEFVKIVEGFNVYWHCINKLPTSFRV